MAENKQHQRNKRQGDASASGGSGVGGKISGKAEKVADERSVGGTTPGEDLDDWEDDLASVTGEACTSLTPQSARCATPAFLRHSGQANDRQHELCSSPSLIRPLAALWVPDVH